MAKKKNSVPRIFGLDLSGKRFGRLFVKNRGPRNKWSQQQWNCVCDCGKETITSQANLRTGQAKSCGCLGLENRVKAISTRGGLWFKVRKQWFAWRNIVIRCTEESHRSYKNYGARGIKVYPEWAGENGFDKFLKDVGDPPSPLHTIGRKDNEGHYEPGNVRWETVAEQNRNKRTNRMITCNGETKCLMDWALEKRIHFNTLSARISRGWPAEKALSTPAKEQKRKATR